MKNVNIELLQEQESEDNLNRNFALEAVRVTEYAALACSSWIGKGEKDAGKFDKFQTISYSSGACTFTKLHTMKKIGLISKLFFAYHDDVDYGWRAAMMNIPSYYEPKSIIDKFYLHLIYAIKKTLS